MTVRVVYFSGTGCTKYVAQTFERELSARGVAVQLHELFQGRPGPAEPCDLLVVCYAVHAANAPRPVMEWAKGLPPADGTPAAVISVSGGGEVTPNLACRVGLIKALRRKGFDVTCEKMLVMPSNWIVATGRQLNSRLLDVLPYKVSYIVSEFLGGKRLRGFAPVGNRIISLLFSFEAAGARSFGRNIRVGSGCTGCSLCAKECPMGNIVIEEGRPRFGGECVLCLNCLYSCPVGALSAGQSGFVLIKEGFSFMKVLEQRVSTENLDIKSMTKGFLWLGLRRYLLNTTDMREPAVRESAADPKTHHAGAEKIIK